MVVDKQEHLDFVDVPVMDWIESFHRVRKVWEGDAAIWQYQQEKHFPSK